MKKLICTVLACTMLATTAFADTLTLTLDKAIETAKENNQQLSVNDYKKAAAEISLKSAYIRQKDANNAPVMFGDTATPLAKKGYYVTAAQTNIKLLDLEREKINNNISYDVTEKYFNYILADKLVSIAESAEKLAKENLEIGSYKGFDMSLSYDSFAQEFHLELQREMSYTVTLGTSESGNILRIDNALDSIEKRIENSKEQLETLNEQLSTAKAELGKPFPQEAELTEKLARLAELNTLLNIDENAIENAAVAAEKKPDIPISADEVKPMRNVFPERKTSILDRIKEMQSAQAGNIPKEKTPTKDKTSEIS